MHPPREVLSVGEESYRRDAFGPRPEAPAQVLFRDPAERDEREGRESARRLFEGLEADGRAVGALRGRVEDRAEDREVRAAPCRRARLLARVRRDAYQKLF